ncbi:MAG: hypothetical protein LBT00_07435 [Spirochaetaceae bacterium]|nr:hypothetical protein [Spirochaetaceae bacterium]
MVFVIFHFLKLLTVGGTVIASSEAAKQSRQGIPALDCFALLAMTAGMSGVWRRWPPDGG